MQWSSYISRFQQLLQKPTSIAPLVTFRILLGGLMAVGAIRFWYNGWVERLYVDPRFFFKFYGFEWVETLSQTGMYVLLSIIILSAAMIMLGLFYRVATCVFFISFTYLELIDATNYLNHYYLVVLLAFLLIFLPAHRQFSIDIWRKPALKVSHIPGWMIAIIIFQISLVYTCAGIAKLNSDWLTQAMPLSVWLPEHRGMPIIGHLFAHKTTAYLFSWFGAFYDLTIAFFLLLKKTRVWAYVAVIVFHVMTKMLFNIGLFPLIMIFSTLIFFPAGFHQKILSRIGYQPGKYKLLPTGRINWKPLLMVFVVIQLLLPFRHLAYPGNILWSEEGYRFSWRVMLVEKVGQATFHVEDPATQRKTEVINGRYLTRFQEKQMSIQPDFILQFAHFLKREYQLRHGIKNPIITVDAHVALNGRTSQQLIDPTVNLAVVKDGFKPKKWILPFKK